MAEWRIEWNGTESNWVPTPLSPSLFLLLQAVEALCQGQIQPPGGRL